ncbi:MAG: hypothetical protein KF709_02480 [Gemmatimonadaceae bacterium]|nr:hypothetical protein [Gemmatimonadaceae bacterium]
MATSPDRARRQRVAKVLGTGLILLVLAGMLTPRGYIAPLPVQLYGGEQIPWTDSIQAEWRDVMRCVGLDESPDTTLRLWRVPPGTPGWLESHSALLWMGFYFRDAHMVVVRPSLDEHAAWRHEFVHARLQDAGNRHPSVFHTHWERCRFLGPPVDVDL